MPENSYSFYEDLLETKSSTIGGLFIVRNVSFDILVKILWLYAIGCSHIATTLVRNIVDLRKHKLERLFRRYNVPIVKIDSVNDSKIVDWVTTSNIDLVINFRARCIFKKELLAAPRLGCVNIHHGILPKYRGLFCDLYALYENRPAGFTIHKMENEIDAGSIFLTKIVSNGEKDYSMYLARLAKEESSALGEFIDIVQGNDSLPQGIPNVDAQKIVTKTPNRAEIKRMLAEGLVL